MNTESLKRKASVAYRILKLMFTASLMVGGLLSLIVSTPVYIVLGSDTGFQVFVGSFIAGFMIMFFASVAQIVKILYNYREEVKI